MRDIAENLARLREDIAQAARRAGRSPQAVTLVAVSKTQSAEAVMAAYEAGQRVFGENRVQEALAKQEALPTDIQWHLVGRLQTNKARFVPGRFALLHSLDTNALAQGLDQQAAKHGQVQPVLLQANLGGETSKGGVGAWEDLLALAQAVALCGHLAPRGLMTIPPPDLGEGPTRQHFATLRQWLERLATHMGWAAFDQLSMGMSGDYLWAIEEGATLVRVGTAIFGQRK